MILVSASYPRHRDEAQVTRGPASIWRASNTSRDPVRGVKTISSFKTLELASEVGWLRPILDCYLVPLLPSGAVWAAQRGQVATRRPFISMAAPPARIRPKRIIAHCDRVGTEVAGAPVVMRPMRLPVC